jgi:hypothetical protein
MLPNWMKDGFVKAMMWRIDYRGASKIKAQIRKMVAR